MTSCSTSPSRGSGAVRLDQDLRDLRPAELRRRQLARGQQLAHARAGKRHVRLSVVRTGLSAGHTGASVAVEGVLEVQRLDAQLARLELLAEDALRVVGAVVV